MKIASVAIALTMAAAVAAGAPAERTPQLRVYLPRSLWVGPGTIRLGDISVVRGTDGPAARKARAVTLGRSPWPGERIVISRRTILSRLAGAGVPAGAVRITGAKAVAVRGKHNIVPGEDIRRCAESFLKAHPPPPAGVRWRCVRPPERMVLKVSGKARLAAAAAKDAPPHHVKVNVSALVDGRKVAATTVLFRLAYPARRVVAVKPIRRGQTVTASNARVEKVMSDTPPPAEWRPPFGRVALVSLPAGAAIPPAATRPVTRAVVVRRNQAVVMRIDTPAYLIRMPGLALQDGRVGDLIKVRNVRSRRVVVAEVSFDGTVRPVFEEKNR